MPRSTLSPVRKLLRTLDEVHSVMKEIEMCQLEGHMLDHHDIPWRVGYLVFCMHHVERVNQRDHSARLLVTQFLDDMGVSLACALEVTSPRPAPFLE